jgi:hypothetical protein
MEGVIIIDGKDKGDKVILYGVTVLRAAKQVMDSSQLRKYNNEMKQNYITVIINHPDLNLPIFCTFYHVAIGNLDI